MDIRYDSVNIGSHLAVLEEAVNATEGPILELGAGIYSTDYLVTAAFLQERDLTIYEPDPAWRRYLRAAYGERPEILDHIPISAVDHWGVVLIDHGVSDTSWLEERKAALILLRGSFDIGLVHDCPEGQSILHDTITSFRHYGWFVPKNGGPHTAVVSDSVSVSGIVSRAHESSRQ